MKSGQLSEADVLLPVAATDVEFFQKFFQKMRHLPTVEQKVKLVKRYAEDESNRHDPYSIAVESVLLSEGPKMESSDIQALLDSKYYFALYWAIRYKRTFRGKAREKAESLTADEKFDVLLYTAYLYYWNDNAILPLWEAFALEAEKMEIPKEYLCRVVKSWNERILSFRDAYIAGNGKSKDFIIFVNAFTQQEPGKKTREWLAKKLGMSLPEAAKTKKLAEQNTTTTVLVALVSSDKEKEPKTQERKEFNASPFIPLLNHLFSRPSEWQTPEAKAIRRKLINSTEKFNEKERDYLKSLSGGAFPVLVTDSERAREMSAFAALLLKNSLPEANQTVAAVPPPQMHRRVEPWRWFENKEPYEIRAWLEDLKNQQGSDPLLLKYAVHYLLRKTFFRDWRIIFGKQSGDPAAVLEQAVNTLKFALKACREKVGLYDAVTIVLGSLDAEEKVALAHFRGLVNALRASSKQITVFDALNVPERLLQLEEELDSAFLGKFPLKGLLENVAFFLDETARGLLRALVRVFAARFKDLLSRPSLPPGCPVPQLFSAEDFIGLLDRAWPAVLRSWQMRKRGLPAEGILVPVLSRLLTAHGFLGLSLRESPKGELRCRWFLRQRKSLAMRFTPGRRTKRNTSTDVLMEILSLYALAAAADACNRFLPLNRRARLPQKMREVEWTVDISVLPTPVSAPDGHPAENVRVKIATRYPRSQPSRPKPRSTSGASGKGCRSASSHYLESGHLRRLLPGQTSSPIAAENALVYGGWPYLPPGYTFERPHWVNKNGEPSKVKFFVPTIHSAALAVSLDAIAVQAALKSGVDLRAYGFEPAKARPGSRLKAMMRFAGDPIDAAELLRS